VPDDPLQRMLDDLPPRDIVRGELTCETLDRFDALAGRTVTITEPGAIVEDVRGIPCAIEEPTTHVAEVVGLTITRGEADRLGIDEHTYAHVHIDDRSTP
jgi:hypothetical protein